MLNKSRFMSNPTPFSVQEAFKGYSFSPLSNMSNTINLINKESLKYFLSLKTKYNYYKKREKRKVIS